MELTVLNNKGETTNKKVHLDETIFGIEPNDHVIYLDVKRYLANQRQGTHKAKNRGEVRGSTRKIRRQKGAGFARAGGIRNPLYKGGGKVFGPTPRDYTMKLNKKVKKLARKSALSYKAKENKIFVIEDFTYEVSKTKEYYTFLNNLKLSLEKTILVLPKLDKNIYLSARNLQKAQVSTASNLTTYDILNANSVLLFESSIKEIENNLSN